MDLNGFQWIVMVFTCFLYFFVFFFKGATYLGLVSTSRARGATDLGLVTTSRARPTCARSYFIILIFF